MRQKARGFALLMGLAAAIFTVGCADQRGQSSNEKVSSPAEGELTILFGVYTADKASVVVDEFAPVIEWLEGSLSESLEQPVHIQMKIANSYLQGIADIAEGDVHFSRLGPASYIHAKNENPHLDILAMESSGGERTFKGIIAIHAESDMESLEELKGRKFAFGSPLSTIGRYLSQSHLMEAGIYGTDLAGYQFLDRHDVVGMAVAAGDFDAGALKSGSFKKLVETGSPLKKLYEFDNVTKPWVAHPKLDERIFAAIREAMLNISAEDAAKIDVDGFLESAHEYYIETGEAMERAKAFHPSLND